MTSTKETPEDIAWYSVPTQEAARRLNVVPDRGLEDYEATRRLAEHGPNELPKEPPRKPGTKMVNRPQLVHWFASGFLVAAIVLAVLEWGPGKPSTTRPSVNMTMAFAIVSFTAVNLGLVMRREREPAWSRPMFP